MIDSSVATINPNPHFITKSEPFYYGNQFKNWSDTPIVYALDIAVENWFSSVLKFPLDRIIYASNDYCFRERTRKNNGNLNLPFFNYHKTNYDISDKLWFNDWSNRFGLHDINNQFTSAMGGKMKVYPITIEYEGNAFFAQNKDCEYAMNKLLYNASNETIINPLLETSDGTILKNAGVLNLDLEYNPSYNENDWLEMNRIHTIGINFSVRTFMIGQFDTNADNLHVAKKSMLQFFSAKSLNYEEPLSSPQLIMLLSEYFEN